MTTKAKTKPKPRRKVLRRPAWHKEWVRTPLDEVAVDKGYYFDLAAAERPRQFFRQFLCHSKGEWAGQPFELMDWEWKDIIGPLFGWKRPNDLRRFNRGHIEVPKKQGKSTLFAGLGTYFLVGDGEPGAEIYVAAATRDQAKIIYNEAANMVEASPLLCKRLVVVRSRSRIAYPETRSILQALSKDSGPNEGPNASVILFDELHVQTTRKLWDALCMAGDARRQPFFGSITTAGFDKESICWEQHQYAEAVIKGTVRDLAALSFLGVIYAADKDDDWRKRATWRKANPSLGITITTEKVQIACQEAQASPRKLNNFLRRRLNLWTAQQTRWLDQEAWAACGRDIDPDELIGEPCYGGLDLASTQDLTAFLLVFPIVEDDIKKYILLPHFWVPEETADERETKAIAPSYRTWAKEGHLTLTPGNVVDYGFIRNKINELGESYPIQEIAYDPWNATQTALDLTGDGFEMIEFRQGSRSMNEPAKAFERHILAGTLIHPNHPVLNWNAANVEIREGPSQDIRPVKPKKNSPEKIDGIPCAIMGIARHMFVAKPTKSIYEERGILTL